MELSDKVILITGGTGSFGQKFVEIALQGHSPRAIRIFSRGEFLQWQMQQKFQDDRLRFLIGDVRDKDRLYRAMSGVDIVVHAAALKQIPTCEYNPIEAVQTNIIGSANVVDAAIDQKVDKVILISSDKAVRPLNLYGTTKLAAEKLFVQGNAYSGGKGTKFSCVRYGNVMGSRGSVLPLFQEQKNKFGKLTITDEKMTRFWLTLEQGVRLIIDCLCRMQGGEIFVPKIPSIKVVDLATAIDSNVQFEIVGIRPGEKLSEVLITEEEARHTKEFDNYFVIEPESPFWRYSSEGGKPLPEGFEYSSNTNKWWLSEDELRRMLSGN